MSRRRGRPIWAAYEDTGALSVNCANCQAEQGVWCTKPDGRVSRVPCVARIASADIAPPTAHEPARLPTPAVDFSEPRRSDADDG